MFIVLSQGQTVIGDVDQPDIQGLLDIGLVQVTQLRHQPQFLVTVTDPSMILTVEEIELYRKCKMARVKPIPVSLIIDWARAGGVDKPLSCLKKLIGLSFLSRPVAGMVFFRE